MNGRGLKKIKHLRYMYSIRMMNLVEIIGTKTWVSKYTICNEWYLFFNDREDIMFHILGMTESELYHDGKLIKEILLMREGNNKRYKFTIEDKIAPVFHELEKNTLLSEAYKVNMYVEELQDMRDPNSSWDREGSPIF